jgi:signal transduction histidine kinase
MNTNYYALLPFIAFLTNAVLLGIGIHRGMTKIVHRNYVHFMACLSLWSFFDFVNWNWSGLPRSFTMFIYRIQVPTYLFLAYFFLRFVFSLIGKKENWFYKSFYIFPLTLSIVGVLTPYMVKSYTPIYWGLRHEPGPLFIPSVIICVFAPAQYALFLLLKFKTQKDTNERSQKFLMIAGCSFVLYVGMYTDLIAPHILGRMDTIQAAGSSVTIMAFCMHRAIAKHYLLPFSVSDTVDDLFQASSQGVLIINSMGNITDMNPAAMRFFSLDVAGRYNADVNLSVDDLLPELDLTRTVEKLEVTRERNDREIFLKLHVNKHSQDKNRDVGWVIMLTDVTAERLNAKAIESVNASLEERVVERTQELEGYRLELIEKTESLERVSHFKSQFLANVTNEIKTPIRGIMAYNTMLMAKSEEVPLELARISVACEALMGLMDDFSEFSRYENEDILLEEGEVNIQELVHECSEVCRRPLELAQRDIQIEVNMEGVSLPVLTDRIRLRQVIINLISNAIKATKKGTIKVYLNAKPIGQSCECLFSVTDVSSRHQTDEINDVFHDLNELDEETLKHFWGTNLAMDVAQRISGLMGGAIDSREVKNAGTEFYVKFSFAVAAESVLV